MKKCKGIYQAELEKDGIFFKKKITIIMLQQ